MMGLCREERERRGRKRNNRIIKGKNKKKNKKEKKKRMEEISQGVGKVVELINEGEIEGDYLIKYLQECTEKEEREGVINNLRGNEVFKKKKMCLYDKCRIIKILVGWMKEATEKGESIEGIVRVIGQEFKKENKERLREVAREMKNMKVKEEEEYFIEQLTKPIIGEELKKEEEKKKREEERKKKKEEKKEKKTEIIEEGSIFKAPEEEDKKKKKGKKRLVYSDDDDDIVDFEKKERKREIKDNKKMGNIIVSLDEIKHKKKRQEIGARKDVDLEEGDFFNEDMVIERYQKPNPYPKGMIWIEFGKESKTKNIPFQENLGSVVIHKNSYFESDGQPSLNNGNNWYQIISINPRVEENQYQNKFIESSEHEIRYENDNIQNKIDDIEQIRNQQNQIIYEFNDFEDFKWIVREINENSNNLIKRTKDEIYNPSTFSRIGYQNYI
ncbi:hypothetical protein, conserved [Entamoeba dispar SAW760]|uniref:Uncharacterized protein n=1 Tax=Entamoeba dispar (strain ATCC PRA-260 / SAW760) TaxID=370354 RepID=B0EQW0_ENTDS|nr:uncharacterized protein EDI_099130 [Entamoeba dispar SAW760]EDR23073.1 hypothetical protein, conserved [Entamoeba dispar SAW760]|eukprot:EDR23073.1 hypothetical protein, conserved [Entamoeba dispar SAW760]